VKIEETIRDFVNPPDNYISKLYYDLECLYRNLKLKAQDDHNQYDCSHWHYSEKEMLRKRIWHKKNANSKYLQWFVLTIYNVLCGYGENFSRAFKVLVGAIILATILIGMFGIEQKVPSSSPEIVQLNLKGGFDIHNSIEIVLTTLEHLTFSRTAEYKPHGQAGRAILILFRIFIPIQITLFGFALRNRFRRR